MKDELKNSLKEKYSTMFDSYLQGRDIECGSGWYALIDETLGGIKATDPNAQIIQIKEKFGLLRMYVDSEVEAVFNIVHFAENLSGTICEVCASPGRPLKGKNAWIRTMCPACVENKGALWT